MSDIATWERQPARIEPRPLQVNDRVEDTRNGEQAVVVKLNTHYFMRKSQEQRPYDDPLATIQYVIDGSERVSRVSRLRKVGK